MANRSQLPYLVSLIEDETKEVREEVLKGLSNYGETLEEDLLEFSEALDSPKLELLNPIFEKNRRSWLENNWDSWQKIDNDNEKLEAAFILLSNYQYGIHYPEKLPNLLDNLANSFREKYSYGNEIDLSNYLFNKNLKGEKEDYYNPLNSNLVYAIKEKKGLPITLVCIFILVASRLKLNVTGCNFPGHFLAKTYLDGELVFVDCFNGGKILFESDFQQIADESYASIQEILYTNITSVTIIQRVLNNLISAYKNLNDKTNSDFFVSLLRNKTNNKT